jgi:hypothetical protein
MRQLPSGWDAAQLFAVAENSISRARDSSALEIPAWTCASSCDNRSHEAHDSFIEANLSHLGGMSGARDFWQSDEMISLNGFAGRGRLCVARSAWVGLWLLMTLAYVGEGARVGAQQDRAYSSIPASRDVGGVVVDVVTGKPIAGALVSTVMPEDWHRRSLTPRRVLPPPGTQTARRPNIQPGPEQQQLTDANGRFQFTAMQLASWKAFYVSRPGYLAPGSDGSFISTVNVSVMPGIGELRFALVPQAEISGKVTSSEGTAMPNVLITLYRAQYTLGRAHWIYFDNLRTDGGGSYRFGDLPAGTYFVVSQWILDNDPLSPDSTSCNDGGFLPTGGFAPEADPGELDFQKATPILLTEGKHAVADLKLQHQFFHPVTIPTDPKLNPGSIEIVDRNGRSLEVPMSPYAHCVRFLYPSGDRQKRMINLPDGNYLFHQRAAYSLNDPFETGGATQPLFLGGYVSVTVAGAPVTVKMLATREDDRPPLQLRIHREATTSSSGVSDLDACSVRGPSVGIVGAARGAKLPPLLQVEFAAVNSFGGAGSGATEKQTGDDLYEISGLGPGNYWVQTQWHDSGYVSAISAKGVDLMQHPLEIGTDETGTPIDITIRNDCGRIHFEKPWTKPPAGAILADPVGIVEPYYELLVPQFRGASPHGQFSEERTLIEYGRAVSATLGNLAPGHYKIFQTFDQNAVACFSPAELEKRLGPGRDVWLKPGEQVNLDIEDRPPW